MSYYLYFMLVSCKKVIITSTWKSLMSERLNPYTTNTGHSSMTLEGERRGQIHCQVSLTESSSLNLWTKSLNLKKCFLTHTVCSRPILLKSKSFGQVGKIGRESLCPVWCINKYERRTWIELLLLL